MFPLLVATRNPHKTREFAQILAPEFACSDLSAAEGFPEVEETGVTFQENAGLKAVAASRLVPGLVIADDSGLEVAALGGAPGIYSARYAGEGASDAENVAKLLEELRVIPSDDTGRAARFCCAIAVAHGGAIIDTYVGFVDGVIGAAPRGEGGFGYDPVFIPSGYEETFAELGDGIKNAISHRAAALTLLKANLPHLRGSLGRGA